MLGAQELFAWVEEPGTLTQFMDRPVGEEVASAYTKHARKLHSRLHMAGLSARGAVLALWCDGALAHVLAGMRASGRGELRDDSKAWERLVQLCCDRGRDWAERLLAAAGDGDLDAHPLLERLVAHHDLTEPQWFRLARLGRPDGVGVVPDPGDGELWYRHLLAALDALPPGERDGTCAVAVEALSSHDSWHPWQLGHWAVPLLARLGATAGQVLWWLREWPVRDEEAGSVEYRSEFLAAVRERGRDFAAEIVAAAEGDPLALRGGIDLLELLVVEHDLPLPRTREYWEQWLWSCGIPGVGRRWQEQFLAACAVKDVMAAFVEPEQSRARIEEAAAVVRAAQEMDDAALAVALLAVWERGDRVSSQRAVVWWVQALGLVDHLRAQRSRLIAALPLLESTARAFTVRLLLAEQLSDAELAEVAVTVLPQGPRALSRELLQALEQLDAAPEQLRETVEAVAQDAQLARRARALLESWG
ncbi:MAG: hypothetical protein Q4D96_14720 [Propionibacteriaceae bacterium]|nr:hypothetical protein [Propionibacteriaceae bacterium]